MAFKVGDKVVYPNHGVGIIQEVTRRNIGGMLGEFYMLRIESNSSLVMIPTGNAESVGLRRLCGKKDLDHLFDILKGKNANMVADWKGRYKQNLERMKTGSILDVAEVLKNLSYLSAQKSLSFREKRMLDRARQLVISEIATVKKTTADNIERLVDGYLTSGNVRTGTA